MKINNPPFTPPAATDETRDSSETTNIQPLQPHNTQDAANSGHVGSSSSEKAPNLNVDKPLHPPINLADYAATGLSHAFHNKLLTAAQKILTAGTPEPEAAARKQIIDLVIKENFRSILTGDERRDIIDTLSKVLNTDPLFCSEVEKMMQLAALKLKPDTSP